MPLDSPLFTVIVPVFNRRGLLARTLESVLQQRFTNFEVIVVDDGSTDDSADVARGFGERVRVLEGPNAGPGAARGRGARASTGRYLAFLDSDDHWFPWTLETYARVVQSRPQPAFVAGKPQRFLNDDTPLVPPESAPELAAYHDYYASGDEWRWWGASSFVIARDAFDAVGGFTCDRVNGEDADLAMRLGVAPGFVQVKQPVTFAYRVHAANATNNLDHTVRGAVLMVEAERAGRYPGGPDRARERRHIISRHVRPVITACFRDGRRRQAWQLYSATLRWHLELGRWRFLLGAPFQRMLHRA